MELHAILTSTTIMQSVGRKGVKLGATGLWSFGVMIWRSDGRVSHHHHFTPSAQSKVHVWCGRTVTQPH